VIATSSYLGITQICQSWVERIVAAVEK